MILLMLSLANAATPDEAVRGAIAHDPRVAAAEGRLAAARGAVRGTGLFLENPTVEVGVGASRLDVSGSQRVPLGGEGVLARGAARMEVEAAEAGVERARLEAAAEARRGWARVVVVDAVRTASESQVRSATRLREAAEARLASGDVADLDVRLARFEEAAAVATWLHDERAARSARADFAALTGFGVAEPVAGDPLDAAPWTASGEGKGRADVRAANAGVEAARRSLAAARAGALPDLTVGAFYERDGDRSVAGPRIGLEVPLWRHNQTAVGSARGRLVEAEAVAAATGARAEAEQAAGQRVPVERAAALIGSLPRGDADTALADVERAYAVGELGLAEVLVVRGRILAGQRAWFEARGAVAEARIDAALAGEAGELVGE